jgi:hypothetical protein
LNLCHKAVFLVFYNNHFREHFLYSVAGSCSAVISITSPTAPSATREGPHYSKILSKLISWTLTWCNKNKTNVNLPWNQVSRDVHRADGSCYKIGTKQKVSRHRMLKVTQLNTNLDGTSLGKLIVAQCDKKFHAFYLSHVLSPHSHSIYFIPRLRLSSPQVYTAKAFRLKFIFSWGETESTWYCGHCLAYCTSPGW